MLLVGLFDMFLFPIYISLYITYLSSVFVLMCRSLMASGNDWLGAFQEYDFNDAYFNKVGSSDAREDNDDDCYTLNFESFPQTVEDAKVKEATQRAGKQGLCQDLKGFAVKG